MRILEPMVVVYVVRGVLYRSLVHPVTVLTTLRSVAGGGVLALLIRRMEFATIAMIGVFLLIGIVKKNAILVIDFAVEAERARGLSAVEALVGFCLELLGIFALLLLGLLGADDSLVTKRGLEPLQLRSGHVEELARRWRWRWRRWGWSRRGTGAFSVPGPVLQARSEIFGGLLPPTAILSQAPCRPHQQLNFGGEFRQ